VQGVVAETGTHEELLARSAQGAGKVVGEAGGGIYASLVARQLQAQRSVIGEGTAESAAK